MKDGFLARWSRRKLEGRDAPIEQEPGAAMPAPELSHPEAVDDVITPEELAALPPIADITLETDIAAFLRKGVPSALRNAALQRLWVLDPDIRNFVGDARDYAWDWNTPGGVPVSGPLEPGTDVAAMLRRIFGEEPAPARENVIAKSEAPPSPPAREQPASPRSVPPNPEEPPAKSRNVSESELAPEDVAPIRRHGGALPA